MSSAGDALAGVLEEVEEGDQNEPDDHPQREITEIRVHARSLRRRAKLGAAAPDPEPWTPKIGCAVFRCQQNFVCIMLKLRQGERRLKHCSVQRDRVGKTRGGSQVVRRSAPTEAGSGRHRLRRPIAERRHREELCPPARAPAAPRALRARRRAQVAERRAGPPRRAARRISAGRHARHRSRSRNRWSQTSVEAWLDRRSQAARRGQSRDRGRSACPPRSRRRRRARVRLKRPRQRSPSARSRPSSRSRRGGIVLAADRLRGGARGCAAALRRRRRKGAAGRAGDGQIVEVDRRGNETARRGLDRVGGGGETRWRVAASRPRRGRLAARSGISRRRRARRNARVGVHRILDRNEAGSRDGRRKAGARQVEKRPHDRHAAGSDLRPHGGEAEDAGAADRRIRNVSA